MDMKKISKHWAGFFKRTLSMLLALVLVVGEPGVISAAAGLDIDQAGAAVGLIFRAPHQKSLRSPQQYWKLVPQKDRRQSPQLLQTYLMRAGETPDGPAVDEGTGTADSSKHTSIIFNGYQNSALDIYNHLYFTNANGGIILSSGSYEISGENKSNEIVIGNHPVDGKNETEPNDSDIPVFLNGLTMEKPMTIKPVGSDNKVMMTVSGASELGDLVVEEDAALELVLSADLTAASIVLGKNSRITISGSGTLTVSGEFTSNGTVVLSGGIIDAKNGLSAFNLSLNGTTIKANSQAVAAAETLSMTDSTVENASLFGYRAASGERVLTLEGNNRFSQVEAVGCEANSNLIVSVNGIGTVSNSKATYYCDYTIAYAYSTGDTDIEQEDDWPVAYRVSSGTTDFDKAKICGYHDKDGYKESENEFPLPEVSKDGYEYKGWKLDNSGDPVETVTAARGNLELTLVLTAKGIIIKLDRDYDPDEYTNDKDADGNLPVRESTLLAEVNGTVSLPVPVRFGYDFKGWKVTSRSGDEKIIYSPNDLTELSYKAELEDCEMGEEGSVVTMKALWEPHKFGLTLFMGTGVDENNIEISVDGGSNFVKYKDLETDGRFTISGRTITFSAEGDYSIAYGENISKFLREKAFTNLPVDSLPVLRDTSAAGKAQIFAGWASAVAGSVDKDSTFTYGKNGILMPQSGQTLADYQDLLDKNKAAVNAVWGVMSYALIFPKNNAMPKGWTLIYTGSDGKEYTIEAGAKIDASVLVQQKTTVTLKTSAVSPENFSLWGFSEDISGKKIIPKEQPYKESDQDLVYQFTMPAANVKAAYGDEDVWIDIARSPIEFKEKETYNNRNRQGFWYHDLIDGMTPLFEDKEKTIDGTDISGNKLEKGAYFYQWHFADKYHFRVTSQNVSTQNRLILVNGLAGGVYFKELHLRMRDAYAKKAIGSLIDGVDCEITNDGPITSDKAEAGLAEKKVDLADYANIVVDNNSQQGYTTTLNFIGSENTVGAIMPDTLRPNDTYKNTLNIIGEGKDETVLNLGSAFGNFVYTIKDIQVNEYTKEEWTEEEPSEGESAETQAVTRTIENKFKYLIHSSNWNCAITNAVVEAKDKTLHVGNGNFSLTDTDADFRSITTYIDGNLTSAYLRIRDDLLMGYRPLRLYKGSKAVIDGNLEMNYQHWSETGDITDKDPNNWLIVKGNRCDLSDYTWTSGTLICNAVIFGRCGGITGGTVITNQILSQPVGFWKYDEKAQKYKHDAETPNQTEKAVENEDDYPFLVYSQHRDGVDTYAFTGGEIYLLGYYETVTVMDEKDQKNRVKYNPDVTVLGANGMANPNNPVAPFMTGVLDTNGDLKQDAAADTAGAQNAVQNSTRKIDECVVLGNSTYNTGTCSRTIKISGDAKIYAAGNLTFFNDTIVDGGTVYCNGSFGTKGDLTISGGTITATTVGNAYRLTTTLEDGTKRWKLTDIKGGTITAQKIGAFEKYGKEGTKPQSTVVVEKVEAISGTPDIDHDVYINYIFGKELFENNGPNPESVRFNAKWNGSNVFGEQDWSNVKQEFTPPTVIGEDDDGKWKWDELLGPPVDTISEKGIPQCSETSLDAKAYDRIQMKLYAVKETYSLIFKDGWNTVKSVTCDAKELGKPTETEKTKAATTGGKVVVEFNDPKMAKDYTVLWYIDGSGIIHNVPDLELGFEPGKISFTMPPADVEVYSTKDLYLDLDIASYTLLQDGFRTESKAGTQEEPLRVDSEFHYMGNLIIHQGSIKKMGYDLTNPESIEPVKVIEGSKGTGKGAATSNNIRVNAGFDNRENGRKVTLTHIYQTGESKTIGIYMEEGADANEGAKANFTLDGPIRICRVRVPAGADFKLTGAHNDPTKDAFFPYVMGEEKSSDWANLGNYYGEAGNITLENMTILAVKNGMKGRFCYGAKKGTNTVTFTNCRYQTNNYWYSGSYFAYNAKEVIFDNSEFTVERAYNWPSPFFENCDDVKITNGSNITITDSGSEKAATKPFYHGITNSLVIDNAAVNLSMREPEEVKYTTLQDVNSIVPEIELRGTAFLTLDQHARLKRLVLGGGTVKVGQIGTGYLLCPDIEVNGGELKAGGIIVSGFYDASHAGADKPEGELHLEENFRDTMKDWVEGKNKKYVNYVFDGKSDEENYKGLVVKGGAVTAEYITGDVNGKVTVTGGKVNAQVIGTTGKLYGYTKYVPQKGEKYIYTYEYVPEKHAMTVSVSGGEVEVTKNLGGIHADVTVSGGTVQLGEDAILGLTETQQKTLTDYANARGQELENFGSLTVTGGEVKGAVVNNTTDGTRKGGSIRMPYGTVTISQKTEEPAIGINVYNMTAECGEITISGVKDGTYDNPFEGDHEPFDKRPHDKLGVIVQGELSAQNLTIDKGSVVYAWEAYANVPKDKEGSITVAVDPKEERAYLYAGYAYGVTGEGDGTYHYNDGTSGDLQNRNVFGHKKVNVRYYLHPPGMDASTGKEIEDVFFKNDIGKETNPNLDHKNGLPDYVVVSELVNDRYYTLQDASCSGYEFLGWYEYDPDAKVLSNTRVKEIDKTKDKDIHLGAKWKRVEVTFAIRIEAGEDEFNPDTMKLIQKGTDENENINIYEFNETATVTYGDLILSVSGVYLQKYTTVTLGILELYYNDEKIKEDTTDTAGSRVTDLMADAFINGGRNPLILWVSDRQPIRTVITLDQNKTVKNDIGYPKETKFNLNPAGKITSGSDTAERVSAFADNTGTLGGITAFNRDSNLIEPAATGYTFGGWYIDKDCSAEKEVTSEKAIAELYGDKTTTLYAKWTPNTYLVRFSANTSDSEKDAPFAKNSQWVTSDENNVPAVGAKSVDAMDYYWVYDSAPVEENGKGFWEAETGEHQETLPCAWRESYVFDGWIEPESGNKITNEDELNHLLMTTLDVDNYKGGSNFKETIPALTLYASYHPVTVTYDLDGGKWAGENPVEANPKFGTPLEGYRVTVEDPAIEEDVDYKKLGKVTAYNVEYFVISTTSDYFVGNSNTYVSGDYRKDLSRKGYTFQGWKKSDGTDGYYGCAPRFEDLSVKADWEENQYNLEIRWKDEAYNAQYESAFGKKTSFDKVLIKNVKVGDSLPGDNWPGREDWYAYNKGEEDLKDKYRLLLGATFAGLDPGDSKGGSDSIYFHYAEAVTKMLNSKTLFDKGDTFFLPEDEAYKADLGKATVTRDMMSTVPDYPTGSSILMFGVYRERSLVFVEKYVDSEGATQEKVMYSHPWREYTYYPYEIYPTDENGNFEELKKNSYVLKGWYMGSEIIDPAREYPHNENDYKKDIEKWKNDTNYSKDTYDIYVYTAYLAQKKIEQTLEASSDPTSTSQSTVSYTLPGSMQEGYLSYRISGIKIEEAGSTNPDGETAAEGPLLELVSVAEMEAHQYDSSWVTDGVTYTADNTVAIELKLTKEPKQAGELKTVELQSERKEKIGEKADAGTTGAYQYIGKEWKLTLTLYHSKVMTKDITYSFLIDYTFEKYEKETAAQPDNNLLADQWLQAKVNVVLTPSLYNVEYRVNLPEPKDKLTLIFPEETKFEEMKPASEEEAAKGDVYHYTAKQGYGSALLAADQTLEVEGYTREYQAKDDDTREYQWSYDYSGELRGKLTVLELSDALGHEERAKELEDGKIIVYTGYVPNEYKLRKDDTVKDGTWTITYSGGADSDEKKTLEGTDAASVLYHSLVTLKPEPGSKLKLTLAFKDKNGYVKTESLENLVGNTSADVANVTENEDGSYTFYMPAKDVTISSLWGLYLDYGTIELYPDGFRQVPVYGGNKVLWQGGYQILQCEDDNWGTMDPQNNPFYNRTLVSPEKGRFHTTKNVLKLYGDLIKRGDTGEDREILLGRLNINSPDSVALFTEGTLLTGKNPAKVKLTQKGKMQAENMLVPAATTLILEGAGIGANASIPSAVTGLPASHTEPAQEEPITLALTPGTGRAAIGGFAGVSEDESGNGAITVSKADVFMTLQAPSVSSGIGPGIQNSLAEYSAVTIQGSKITVKESASGTGEYTGAWIGGAGVTSVTMNGTYMDSDSSNTVVMQNAKAVDGTTVDLKDCHIGETNPVKEPIHAAASLKVTGSQIYQSDLPAE